MRLVMQSVCFQFRVGFKRWTKPFAPWQYLAWAVSSFSLRLWIVNPCKSNIDHYNSHIHPGVSQLFPTFIRVSIVRFFSNLRRSNNQSHVQGGDGFDGYQDKISMRSTAEATPGPPGGCEANSPDLFRWDIASSLPTECYWHGRYDVHQSTNWSPQRIHH